MAYEDELESTLASGSPSLRTIIEGKECSTSGESELEGQAELPGRTYTGFSMRRPSCHHEVVQEKVVQEKVEERTMASIHKDVDGGWAWVVFVAMFVIFAISSGLLYSSGLYYAQMLIEYGHSRAYTAWLGSLLSAFFMLGGPVSSIFIGRFGCRVVIMLGAVITSAGCVASAFTTSLEALFITYGIIVACGMNFCYSGQIIALAEYFYIRHSLATSGAMVGIGCGIFFMNPFLEWVVQEFGWRGSYIVSGGLALQMAVMGALVFPLPSFRQLSSLPQKNTTTMNGVTASVNQQHFLRDKHLSDRSFSSDKLSAGAGYLAHSISSLHEFNRIRSFSDSRAHAELDFRSDHHCSRMSVFPGFRFSPSSAHLSHGDLLTSTHSQGGCSRRGSGEGGTSLISNIFLQLPLKGLEAESVSQHRTRSRYWSVGSNWAEENSTILEQPHEEELTSHTVAGNQFREEKEVYLLHDPRFWLVDFAVFFCMIGTLTLYIIYKDLAISLGVGEYYSMAMAGIGFGDLSGRLAAGFITSTKWGEPLLCYSISMLICGFVLVGHLFVTKGIWFMVITYVFGVLYGSQNILIAVAPARVFGRQQLIIVFGYILFFAGVGALLGAPIAGWIVDKTGNYTGVLWLAACNCWIGGMLMLLCYSINRVKMSMTSPESLGTPC